MNTINHTFPKVKNIAVRPETHRKLRIAAGYMDLGLAEAIDRLADDYLAAQPPPAESQQPSIPPRVRTP